MPFLLSLLILAANPDAPIEGRYPDAIETFSCGFESDWDKNYDSEADGWVRKRGAGYPHYVSIGLSEMPTPEGKQCLKIEMDGGAAAMRPATARARAAEATAAPASRPPAPHLAGAVPARGRG